MLPVFVINLDRSTERWEAISRPVEGLDLHRVRGVDGRAVPRAQWRGVDHGRFRRCHGRGVLPGEYGCYRSHLAALEAVVEAGAPLAIIAEDDIELNGALAGRVEALAAASPGWRALKLVNHRVRGFVGKGASGAGDVYGRCLHGPQGSAACYAVTGAGARLLAGWLSTMWLPYDIALERGWDTGASIMTTRTDLVAFSRFRADSSINSGADLSYGRSKPPMPGRWPAALFRARDYARRIAYALR